MNNVVYLVLVVALSCAGMLLLWVKNRDPISPGSSVDQFQDKMQALAPPESEIDRSASAPSDQGTSRQNREV